MLLTLMGPKSQWDIRGLIVKNMGLGSKVPLIETNVLIRVLEQFRPRM